MPLTVGGVESSDRAETAGTRGPAALRRRFDALLATPLRAHHLLSDNAALSHIEIFISSYPPRGGILFNYLLL